ncbi:MAG: N-acetylmuramoyl-L-alanine amidase [Planctomycetota bacterium]
MNPITIDPGHGGKEPAGKSSAEGMRGPGGTLERDVTLALATRVAERLAPHARLTRGPGENPTLHRRQESAREAGTRVLLSIHASGNPERGRGTETWAHARSTPRSRALAETVHARLVAATGADAGAYVGELALLAPDRMDPSVAACLVEVDNLQSAEGEAWLRDEANLDAVADALAEAIATFERGSDAPPVAALQDAAGGDCSGWESDPESLTKLAADKYLREEHGVANPRLQRVWCPTPHTSAPCWLNYENDVTVMVSLVHLHRREILVRRQGTDQRRCRYRYHCTSANDPVSGLMAGELVLTKIHCDIT